MRDLVEGDRVCVIRTVRVLREAAIWLAPGDFGLIERLGDNFATVRVRGVRVNVPRDDLVRAGPPGAVTREDPS